ncbi:MAG: hypothetical protein L6R40_007472 [Gallowayella cf. fulva]|nr:MAG: hypothetical protein L6R40_007472 [Xanthomendoza cf. fulva]
MASAGDEDLVASKTDGFKVGEKKTVEEYAKLVQQSTLSMLLKRKRLSNFQERELRRSVITLTSQIDQNDESLNRWKASLGISNSPALPVDPQDTRRCVIHSLALEVPNRPDMTIDLSVPGALESLKSKPFSIKEGAKFRMKASFKVQHDVLSGLKYLQVVKRKGIRVSKDEEMLGSYAPNTQEKQIYEKKFAEDEAPSGMMARGHYEAVSKFVDDDDHTHLKFEWSFDIAKDWK